MRSLPCLTTWAVVTPPAPVPGQGVVACNMSDVPLGDASVDVAVFCLSLMGTDYGDALAEAHRALVAGGTLWVAEARAGAVQPVV